MQDDKDHLTDRATGTKHGVPEDAARGESKGVPDSGRHASETAPIHPEAGKEQGKDI